MTSRIYLISIILASIIFWILFGLIIVFENPQNADYFIFLGTFASLFLAVWGTFSVIIFYIKVKFSGQSTFLQMLRSSIRQAGLAGIFLCSLLVLNAYSLLTIWTLSLMLLLVFLIELIIRSRK